MNKYNVWSPWYPFGDVFEYRGLIDETGETNRTIEVEWKGTTAFLHRDNGFRLRSLNYRTGSFSNMELENTLIDVPCPLNNGDIGVYWLKIETPLGSYDYIGLSGSEKTSIFKRLVDHFTKIAGTFEPSSGFGDTKNFKAFREEMEKLEDIDTDSPDFFKNNVKICFVKFKEGSQVDEKVAKIEGMAIQAFKGRYKKFPKLNARDETIGLERMPLE